LCSGLLPSAVFADSSRWPRHHGRTYLRTCHKSSFARLWAGMKNLAWCTKSCSRCTVSLRRLVPCISPEYLGCEVIRDRAAGTLLLCQSTYIHRILAYHGMLDTNPVKTPLAPGERLSTKDSPATPDPEVHRQYSAIIGHLSFLVMMTRPDLAFAFAELSKFVQCPGETHLKVAKRMLAYLKGTVHEGITFFRPTDAKDVNRLMGWVDSDYAVQPAPRSWSTAASSNARLGGQRVLHSNVRKSCQPRMQLSY